MDIRRRTDVDVDGCEALAAVVRAVDGYPPHLPQELRQFVASPDAFDAWVAEVDGHIVGHVALNQTTSDEVVAHACEVLNKPAESLGVVARLFVSPAYRRAGAGGRLLQAATEACNIRGLTPILDVATHFEPAIALYEKHGWRRIGYVTVAFRERDLHEFVYVGPGQVVGSTVLVRPR